MALSAQTGYMCHRSTMYTVRGSFFYETRCISHMAGEQHNHTIELWNNRI